MTDITELAASGPVNWEKSKAASYTEPGTQVVPPYDGPEFDKEKEKTSTSRFYYNVPDGPPDFPYDEYPYGQLQKVPGKNPTPTDWSDGVAAYKRSRAPGRLWGPSFGISPTDGGRSQKLPKASYRRPIDTAIDGPHQPNLSKQKPYGVFFDKQIVTNMNERFERLSSTPNKM